MTVLGWHVDPGCRGLAGGAGRAGAVPWSRRTPSRWPPSAQAALARLLLDPREAQLAAEVADLRRSRVDLVDAFETERRRIERDLHDGVQQRLVALTMTLGRAELDVPEGPGLATVQDAHRQAEEALAELRGTIRGIHPRVLVDHGLAAAVHELADRSSVPTTVDIRLPDRLPPPVEQAAYFVVSEALTNVARHSGARRAGVHAWRRDDAFVLTVEDDGAGGATCGRHRNRAGRPGRPARGAGWDAAGDQPARRSDGGEDGVPGLRIVLAEDAALLREGLVGILERSGHEVLAAVEDADALLAFTARLQPDLVVTDIRMPPTHTDEGLRAAAQIRAEHPGIAIMVLSAYVAEAYVPELLDATTGARRPGSATCSRTGSGTSASSSPASTGSRPARPSSTRRWSGSCSGGAAATARSGRSPTASERCWR